MPRSSRAPRYLPTADRAKRRTPRIQLRERAWVVCLGLAVLLALYFALHSAHGSPAQTGLQVTYGRKGLQTLSYNGVVLEDVSAHPEDAFHIWHMKSTTLGGAPLTEGQYGWGETNNSRTWDTATHTWTYTYTWGSIAVQFVQSGDTLNMTVTETDNAGSGMQFHGATIYPLALHLPRLPVGFANAGHNQFAFNTAGPSITTADYGSGQVSSVVADAARPLYSGFQPTGAGIAYTAIISSTSPDSLAAFQPHNDRTVAPGQTDRFTVALRFASSGTGVRSLASDVFAAWAAKAPAQLDWKDRRVIGTAYLASSAPGDEHQPAGYPNNPRRYFNDGNNSDFDVRTAPGLLSFQRRMLQQARDIATNLRRLNAQGIITWDIEGEQYPMSTSYACSPDQIATLAPEMESIVTEKGSPDAGSKLDDAYFRILHDAGFRTGVCVRPQNLLLSPDGSARQVTLSSDAEVTDQLIRKMRYAHDRWGVTLFYIDSAVNGLGAPLSASIFQRAAAALPDSLLMPEESTPLHYAYTAPFKTFLFHGDLGTNNSIRSFYPEAFSVNLVNDVDAGKLAAHRAELTTAVQHGDVLMVHADYWHPNSDTVLQIYKDAAAQSRAVGTASNRLQGR